jgi:uncharacterized cupin superfamily protein
MWALRLGANLSAVVRAGTRETCVLEQGCPHRLRAGDVVELKPGHDVARFLVSYGEVDVGM